MDVGLQERLVTSGLLSQEQLNQAITIHQQGGGGLREALVGLGFLSDTQVQRVQAEVLGKKFYSLEELLGLSIPTAFMRRLSYSQALEWMVLPHSQEGGNELELICSAPPTVEQQRLMAQLCNTALGDVALSSNAALQKAIRYHYGRFMLELLESGEGEEASSLPTPSPEGPPKAKALRSTQSQILLRQEALCPSCQYPYEHGARKCLNCGLELDTAPTDPLIGEVVGKRWRLLRPLGEGGMGLVYQAQEIETKELCAIKFLRSHGERAPEEKEIRRFEKEAKILSELQHRNILQLRAYGVSRSLGFYLATEYLDGLSLDRYAEKHEGYIPFMRVCQLLCQVCDAMEFAHHEGVIHRDIKPENIFMTHDENGNEWVKVIDFGIAHKRQAHETRLTSTGMMIGTPRYIAPEQILGKDVGAPSDIYALAVILFEMLTFKDLFVAENVYEYLMRHVYAEPPQIRELCPERNFPPMLEALVQEGLAKKPEHRPPSMAAFRNRLLRVASLPWARQEKETTNFLRPGFDVLRLSDEISLLPSVADAAPTRLDVGRKDISGLAFAPTDTAMDAFRPDYAQDPASKKNWPQHLDPPDIWVDDEPSSSSLVELREALDRHDGGFRPPQASPYQTAPTKAAPSTPTPKPPDSNILGRMGGPPQGPLKDSSHAISSRRVGVPSAQARWTPEQKKRSHSGWVRWFFLLFLLVGFAVTAFVYFAPEQTKILMLRAKIYFSGAKELEKDFPTRKPKRRKRRRRLTPKIRRVVPPKRVEPETPVPARTREKIPPKRRSKRRKRRKRKKRRKTKKTKKRSTQE
ncbi:MAG: protein kinase [Myxococcales bacterium]|nr:protein kinase [Myxococcales bacterium]